MIVIPLYVVVLLHGVYMYVCLSASNTILKHTQLSTARSLSILKHSQPETAAGESGSPASHIFTPWLPPLTPGTAMSFNVWITRRADILLELGDFSLHKFECLESIRTYVSRHHKRTKRLLCHYSSTDSVHRAAAAGEIHCNRTTATCLVKCTRKKSKTAGFNKFSQRSKVTCIHENGALIFCEEVEPAFLNFSGYRL